MLSALGHDPGTTNIWFNAEAANTPVDRVKNGFADGILPLYYLVSNRSTQLKRYTLTARKKPFCSASLPMTPPMIGTTPAT